MRERFIRGQGQYLDDLPHQDCLWAAFVRSPHAHARIQSVRCPEALAGSLVALVTGRELAGRLQPIKLEAPGLKAYDWYPMQPEKALFVGDPVAVVVARDRYQAEDLANAIEVDYELLAAVSSMEEALAANVAIHPEVPDNIFFKMVFNQGGTKELFAQADLVVERTFYYPRQTAVPLECRGVIARYDPREERFTVWTSTQVPHHVRAGLAQALGVGEEKVRVIRPDIGGAFGLKAQMFPEEVILPWLARELGAPVKWVEDRRENLLASVHAHEEEVKLAVAFMRDGTILAVRAEIKGDAGAHSVYPFGAGLDPFTTAISLFGAYRYKALEFDAVALATNKTPAASYRGVGQNAAIFAAERIIDIAACQLGIDPAELRLRNLLSAQDFPYTAPSGSVYDTGDYRATLQLALERAGYDRLREEQRQARQKGRLLGIGIATYNEVTGVTLYPGYDGVTVRIDPDGRVYGLLSTASSGQGHPEVYGRIIARELGIPPERVHIIEGDTDLCPVGTGTFASRSAVTIGNLLLMACQDLRGKLLQIAALMLKAEEELAIREGRIHVVSDPSAGVTFDEVVRAAYLRTPGFALPREVEPGLEVTRYDRLPQNVFSSTSMIALVEVDPESCKLAIRRYAVVGDCGRILDRETVDAQLVGGVAMGIGCAVFEQLVYDESGQLLTGSLMDYLMPIATEVPSIEVEHLETPSTVTLNAAKGMGESGTMGVGAALANAVADALADKGAELTHLPLSEDLIYRLLHQRKSS